MTDKEIFEHWDEIKFNKSPKYPPAPPHEEMNDEELLAFRERLQALAQQYVLSKTVTVENPHLEFTAVDYPLPNSTRRLEPDFELDLADVRPTLHYSFANAAALANQDIYIYNMSDDYYYLEYSRCGYEDDGKCEEELNKCYIVPKKDFDIYDLVSQLDAATTAYKKKYGFFLGSAKLEFEWL